MEKYYQVREEIYYRVDKLNIICVKVYPFATEISILSKGFTPPDIKEYKEIDKEAFNKAYKIALKKMISKL